MTIIHTSDWHLGRRLYGRRRYAEFSAFLDWLSGEIERQEADALLVAGDVFDSASPGNRDQELYYRFLFRVAESACRHVVIIAGNHDSASFLEAPKDLLKALNIHVVASACSAIEDEVLTLQDECGEPELLVCAVPYLRERDVRQVEAGESLDDKERKYCEGIQRHYEVVTAFAEKRRETLGRDIPIVVMGHLFAAGGKTLADDGVRELYVGSLAHVSGAIFPDSLDYVALGHLHVPQTVRNSERLRYSGSPLPVGFGEAGQEKSVCVVSLGPEGTVVSALPIPVFQELERIRGDWESIDARIRALAGVNATAWLEVLYEGEEIIPDLRERLDAAIAGTGLEILRISNNRLVEGMLGQEHAGESLSDLDVHDVFARCLADYQIPEEQRQPLLRAYGETLESLFDESSG